MGERQHCSRRGIPINTVESAGKMWAGMLAIAVVDTCQGSHGRRRGRGVDVAS